MTIDLNKIKEYTGADDDFTFMLFDRFLGHIDEDIEQLKQETKAENWMAVKAKVHSMLSTARIFFLEDIIILSEEVEKNCQSDKPGNVPAQVEKLIAMYRDVEGEINGLKKGKP